MLSLEALKKENDLINEIDWDLGPEDAVKLYLEWGNTDWGSGKYVIRSKNDYSTYFVVNCWEKTTQDICRNYLAATRFIPLAAIAGQPHLEPV